MAAGVCVTDTGGADDISGTQKDLNEYCQSTGNDGGLAGCTSADVNLTWTWDDTGWSGSNTGDACALYDTDGDGKANYALCAVVSGDPAVQAAGSPAFYLCDDTKALNCGGAVLQAAATSSCAVSSVSDPFSGAHGNGNACAGTDCSTLDTQAQCCLKVGDFPAGTTAALIDVCSYPSSSASSSPSECVKAVLCNTDSDCATLDDACNTGTCVSDGLTNRCVATPKTDGTTCNDGDACTNNDACQAGTCVGVNVECTASDQCHVAGTCDPATGQCSNPAAPDGTACDDGNACTQTDTCQTGTCTGSNPVTCSALDQCHLAGTCDPASGVCSNPSKPNGTACDDGNACTQTDTCQVGACTGSNPVTCSALDQCHVAGTCDPASGVCSNPSKPDGTGCNDGNACTQTDTCQSGTCTGSSPVSCSALDQCHVAGTCDPTSGVCSNPSKPDGTGCNDGNACTQTDTCQTGTCTGSNPITCSALDQCHVAGTCDPMSGVCSNPSKPDGTGCNDGNACTQTDICHSGTCTGGDPVICTALDQCHDPGLCDTASGMCSNPAKANGSTCSDGNACTQSDTCQSGACVGGNPKVCQPLDACHDAGTCSPGTGLCSNPVKPADYCDDHSVCTIDSCNPQTGCVHQAISCNDSNACTTDSCDPTAGCQHAAITCNDGSICTTDSCEPATGCKYVFDPSLDVRCTETHACRSPGFWGTHAGDPYNLTQMAIDTAGGCLDICGEVVTNTVVSSADSALESICISPRGDMRLQLARQLTAMSLNCAMDGFYADCSGHVRLAPLFATCNDACTNGTGDVGDCIAAIDCFNNGGETDPATGLCLFDTIANCHLRSLPPPFDVSTGATSSQACSAARKNGCTLLPPGELTGCTQPGLELDPAIESCNP